MKGRTLNDRNSRGKICRDYYSGVISRLTGSFTARRLVAMYIDHLVIWIPLVILNIAIAYFSGSDDFQHGIIPTQDMPVNPVLVNILYPIYTFKDISGRSLGKRLFRLEIVNTKSDEALPKWKLVLRNLLSPLWAIDSIIVILSGRRLLDHMLGIDVRKCK